MVAAEGGRGLERRRRVAGEAAAVEAAAEGGEGRGRRRHIKIILEIQYLIRKEGKCRCY